MCDGCRDDLRHANEIAERDLTIKGLRDHIAQITKQADLLVKINTTLQDHSKVMEETIEEALLYAAQDASAGGLPKYVVKRATERFFPTMKKKELNDAKD